MGRERTSARRPHRRHLQRFRRPSPTPHDESNSGPSEAGDRTEPAGVDHLHGLRDGRELPAPQVLQAHHDAAPRPSRYFRSGSGRSDGVLVEHASDRRRPGTRRSPIGRIRRHVRAVRAQTPPAAPQTPRDRHH